MKRKLGGFVAEVHVCRRFGDCYTLIVTRVILAFSLLAIAGWAGQQVREKQPPAAAEPPEEDVSLHKDKEYALNPVQAEKEFKIGLFYAKKGSWRAAAGRFEEAAKWNPGYLEAFLKLADAAEKLNDRPRAKQALEQFLEAAPEDDRRVGAVKKRLAAIPPQKP